LKSDLQSICILRLSAIGDVCHAVSAVQAIQKQHPNATITWIIGKIEFQLLKGLPGIEFVIFEKSLGKQAYKNLQQDLKGSRFDVLLHMQVAFRANWAARFINADKKIGFDWHRAKELHALFTNHRIKPQSEPHVLEGFFGFAEQLGVPIPTADKLTWSIPVSEQDKAFATEHFESDVKGHVVIAPAASKAERNWLPERYAALADYANSLGYVVTLCGGPGPLDRETGDAILAASTQPIRDLIGKTTLKQMLACLNRASLVIAPDTGPAHMAVTQRTPVLGLYAHSNPSRTGPYLYQDYVCSAYEQHIQAQQNKALKDIKWGTRAKGKNLMSSISVDDAKRQFDRLVADFNL
jgi:heptosyltransferase I